MIIFTAGYEGAFIADFVRLLADHKIRQLADIRDIANSRRPGFSKMALSRALEAADIQYSHVKELGCPQPIRAQYRSTGDWNRYTAEFKRYLASQQKAVTSMREVASAAPTCLMCYEADVTRCHRFFVAEEVARSGGRIRHLSFASRPSNASPD